MMPNHSYNKALQAKAFVVLGGFILSLSLVAVSYLVGTAYADYVQAKNTYQNLMKTSQNQRQANFQPRPDNASEITESANSGDPTASSNGLDPAFKCDYYSLCDLAEAFAEKDRVTTSILKSCLDYGLPADDNESVLNCFIGSGHTDLELLSLLIAAGADPNGVTLGEASRGPLVAGITPYDKAINLRDPMLLGFLLGSGSDAQQAIKIACLSQSPEIVEVILEEDIDLENDDEFVWDHPFEATENRGIEGWDWGQLTPLQLVCTYPKLIPNQGLSGPEVVSLLLQAGADPRNGGHIGREPLEIVRETCEKKHVKGLSLVAARQIVKILEEATGSQK